MEPCPQPKRSEKTVDPEDGWVYIDECQPLKGNFSARSCTPICDFPHHNIELGLIRRCTGVL
jgi:hypothetical protein